MKKQKIGVITLAITLISLGVLLTMNNLKNIDIKGIFSIVWPSIIILFGIEIIVTKIILTIRSDETRSSIDSLSVVLLTIIIVITLIYSSLSFNNMFGIFSFTKFFDVRNLQQIVTNYKHEETFSNTFSIDAKDKEELQVLNSFGNVEITESSGETIEIFTEIKIRYNDENYAVEVSKDIVKIQDFQNSVKIASNLDSLSYDKNKVGEISVSYDIRIPSHMKINIENKFGNSIVRKIKNDIQISNEHGNIKVTEIEGKIILNNSFGNTTVEDINGSVEIDCKHGDVTLNNISNGLKVINSFGSVNVYKIIGDVYIENTNNDVNIDTVEGNVKVKNKFGEIDTKNIIENLNIENENGDTYIESVSGDVYTITKFGNIELKNANKFVKIISKNGDISYIASEKIETGVEIENEFGNIDVSVPSGQNGNFNLIAEFGEINNKLGLALTEGITEQSINDVIGSNYVKFYIRSRNGNIKLNTN